MIQDEHINCHLYVFGKSKIFKAHIVFIYVILTADPSCVPLNLFTYLLYQCVPQMLNLKPSTKISTKATLPFATLSNAICGSKALSASNVKTLYLSSPQVRFSTCCGNHRDF